MEEFTQFLFAHATYAHWVIFGALLLAGLNLPMSEDLAIITSAVLASLIVPENLAKLYFAVLFGCYFSDWICYSIGRFVGPKLWNFKWFAKLVSWERIEQIKNYYSKYGFWTLLIGRFIPFGVRNCLFLTAGLGKMHFGRFMACDGIACFCSNTTLFTISYLLSKNYEALISAMKTFNILLFSAFVVSVIGFIWYKWKKKVST